MKIWLILGVIYCLIGLRLIWGWLDIKLTYGGPWFDTDIALLLGACFVFGMAALAFWVYAAKKHDLTRKN